MNDILLTPIRRLVADYKDSAGKDLHQEFVALCCTGTTDEALVQSVREELDQAGCKLSGLAELREGGGINYLYMDYEAMIETVHQLGLRVPEDPAAALEAAGLHPVNWRDFQSGS